MQYLLMIYGDEAAEAAVTPPDATTMSAGYSAYTKALEKAGVLRGGERLRPTSSATTVRMKDGKSEVMNGPYAETREQLGGYYLIDAPDMDAAISWASKCPGAQTGTIEVRPVWSVTP